MAENCKDGKNLKVCIEKVHQSLAETQLNIHSKRFILLTAGAVATLLPWIIPVVVVAGAVGWGLALSNNAPAKVHLPYEDNGPLAQIENLGDNISEVAFAIGEGEEAHVVVTVTVTPTPIPTPKPE